MEEQQGRTRARVRSGREGEEQEAERRIAVDDELYDVEEAQAGVGGQTWRQDRFFRQQLGRLFDDETVGQLHELLPPELYVADVAAGVERFSTELELAARIDNQVPCVNLGDDLPTPVDSRGVLLNAPPQQLFQLLETRTPEPGRHLRLTVQRILASAQLETIYLTSGDARYVFREHLVRFLQARSGGVRQQAAQTGTGLIMITVHTQSASYRIHYCPIYLFNNGGTYLGSPTTPVRGYVPAGIFKFGGDKPGTPTKWDGGSFDVTQNTQVHLTAI